jgi:shikimate dehydrogenase
MHGASPGERVADLVPWAHLAPGTHAYDVVYNPRITPFLARARAFGLTATGGLGMLVGQAAHAFELWLGLPAPREQMGRAAERALAERTRS